MYVFPWKGTSSPIQQQVIFVSVQAALYFLDQVLITCPRPLAATVYFLSDRLHILMLFVVCRYLRQSRQ